MNAPKNTIVYLALGDSYISQAIFSLLTLVHVYRGKRPNIQIVVYTDSCARFDSMQGSLDIRTVDVTRKTLDELMGPHRDVLRAKIMVIGETMDRGSTNLLYVDTDTIFLRRVDLLFNQISSGRLFLHKGEWRLRRGRKLNPELCPSDLSIVLSSGRVININDDSMMMNSGVVGISQLNRNLIADVVDLHEQLYAIYPSWHVEQFSFSLIFGCFARTSGCTRAIFHYWHNKNKVNRVIGSFFANGYRNESNRLHTTGEYKRRAVWGARIAFYRHEIRVAIRDLPFAYRIYRTIRKWGIV